MLEDKAAARHRLEVCVTTKRVMLPLMRESCMAALRAEFEAHARRLLGPTAATMQSPAPSFAMPQVQPLSLVQLIGTWLQHAATTMPKPRPLG